MNMTQSPGRKRTLRREDKKLAQRIRQLRIEQGLTQEALSLRLGHNPSYLAYVETYRSGIGLQTLYKLAKIFGVPVKELFTF